MWSCVWNLSIYIHICSAQAHNQLTFNDYYSRHTANMHVISISAQWMGECIIKSRPNTFADILMKLHSPRDSAATPIHLFSPEHANSSVNFLTESLKAAGTKDTSVWGAEGSEGGGLLPLCSLSAWKDNCLLLTQRDGCISMTYTRYSSPLLHNQRCHSGLP